MSKYGPNTSSPLWMYEEHQRFLDAIQAFPRGPWKRIARLVGPTRTLEQVLPHAVSYRKIQARHLLAAHDVAPGPQARHNQDTLTLELTPHEDPPPDADDTDLFDLDQVTEIDWSMTPPDNNSVGYSSTDMLEFDFFDVDSEDSRSSAFTQLTQPQSQPQPQPQLTQQQADQSTRSSFQQIGQATLDQLGMYTAYESTDPSRQTSSTPVPPEPGEAEALDRHGTGDTSKTRQMEGLFVKYIGLGHFRLLIMTFVFTNKVVSPSIRSLCMREHTDALCVHVL